MQVELKHIVTLEARLTQYSALSSETLQFEASAGREFLEFGHR